MIHGFSVFMRSKVGVANSSDVIKAEGAAAAAGDQDVMMLWQSDMVRRAVGAFKIFFSNSDPAYQGDVLSAAIRFGAQKTRNDGKGIVGIFENTV